MFSKKWEAVNKDRTLVHTIKSKHFGELHFLMRWLGSFFLASCFIYPWYYFSLEWDRFTHITALLVICFFYLLLIKSIVWIQMLFSLSIHQLMDILVCFQLVVIINNMYQFNFSNTNKNFNCRALSSQEIENISNFQVGNMKIINRLSNTKTQWQNTFN